MRHGYHISLEYQRALNLSDADAMSMLEYIRYWGTLRVCCGSQMSDDYRNRLQRVYLAQYGDSGGGGRTGKRRNAAQRAVAEYTAHRAQTDPLYDACGTFDLAAVESALIQARGRCSQWSVEEGSRLVFARRRMIRTHVFERARRGGDSHAGGGGCFRARDATPNGPPLRANTDGARRRACSAYSLR